MYCTVQRMSSQLQTTAIIIARYCAAKLQHLGFPSGLTQPKRYNGLYDIYSRFGFGCVCEMTRLQDTAPGPSTGY